jgi:hypothetical protein
LYSNNQQQGIHFHAQADQVPLLTSTAEQQCSGIYPAHKLLLLVLKQTMLLPCISLCCFSM